MNAITPLLTIPATAKLLGVSEDTVESLIRQGRLPALRVGRQWRIEPRRLDEWMTAQIEERRSDQQT